MKETWQKADQEYYLFPDLTVPETVPQMHLRIITRNAHNDSHKKRRTKRGIKLKRGLDIFISLIVVIFFLPWIFLFAGIFIKLESKGPVLFKQLRSGKNNKLFWCYKFRTMIVNDESNVLQATRTDKRITRVGRLLRKTSIDEFPQFLNVLKGDMSLVGPRPHMPKLDEVYAPLIENYMERLNVKQGLTGWAQVNGFRGETIDTIFMERRIEHDIWYLENWSFWLDIKIIFSTLFLFFKNNQNAY